MDSADLLVLEQIGITQLLAHAHEFTGPGAEQELHALDRLTQLGLVARSDTAVAGGVSLTPAGVEALAYLTTAA